MLDKLSTRRGIEKESEKKSVQHYMLKEANSLQTERTSDNVHFSTHTHRFGDDTLHGPREGSGHAEAAIVEDVHGHFESTSNLSQHTLRRDTHVLKIHLCRVGRFNAHLFLWRTTERRKKKK